MSFAHGSAGAPLIRVGMLIILQEIAWCVRQGELIKNEDGLLLTLSDDLEI